MGDGLEGLVDAGLGQGMAVGPRLAQAVARVPDDIVDGVDRSLLAAIRASTMAPAPVGAGRNQVDRW